MTVAQYLPQVRGATTPSAVKVYDTYWRLLVDHLGDYDVAEVLPSHLAKLALMARETAVTRRGSRAGIGAQEHFVAASRRFFAVAVADGLRPSNPATMVPKPKRSPSERHALSGPQVRELFEVLTIEENHLCRFLLETGARREGLLNLSRPLVHPSRQTVILDEKGSRTREQPVTASMCALLLSDDCDLYGWTRRRLDGLWIRVRSRLLWADEIGLSTHWLRHTAVTWIERVGGYPVAAAFAGHVAAGTTATYVTVNIHDVAAAFSKLYGERHPLA